MAMRVRMSAQSWSRSRFATSPAMEAVGVFRHRDRHPASHAQWWYEQARRALPVAQLSLLEALIPANHASVPDFLTPVPRSGETMDEIVARIAATPGEEVDYHLDISIRDRRVWPQVAALHTDHDAYERWRRPMPSRLAGPARDGGAAVAEATAEAISMFFRLVLAPDWPRVRAVLEADIAHRADRMVSAGAAALLDELGEQLCWTGTELVLDRTYSGDVDWAEDGVLFVPTTTHVGPVLLTAERPHSPVLWYGARGVQALREKPARPRPSALTDLLGTTRATLLLELDAPRSTLALSRATGWSASTVSYHLGILMRAGLVDRSRRGRLVLYRRTMIGAAIVNPTRRRASGADH